VLVPGPAECLGPAYHAGHLNTKGFSKGRKGKGKGVTSSGCGQPPREAGEGKAREKTRRRAKKGKKGQKHPRSRLAQAGRGKWPIRKRIKQGSQQKKQAWGSQTSYAKPSHGGV